MALLPTIITLGNGVCGVVAVFMIGTGLDPSPDKVSHFQRAAWLILGGMVFDALDGLAARMTRTASNFGAQLDSLCDLITFGVAPAFLVYAASPRGTPEFTRLVLAVCVFYAMCALIRLARFTVETAPDESAHKEFAGLPSPAAAGVVAAALLPSRVLDHEPAMVLLNALPWMALILGVLMVSRIKYIHVMNRLFRGNRPFVTLVELALVAVLIYLFLELAIFLAFFGYAVAGPLLWLKNRLFRKAPSPVPDTPTPPGKDEDLF